MLFALRAGIVLIGADLIRKIIKYKPKDFDDEVDEETDEETDTESVEPETPKKGIKGLISKAKEYYHDNFDSSDETLEEEYNREHPNDNVIAFPTKQEENTEETTDEPKEDDTAEEAVTENNEVESKPRLRDRIKKFFTIEDPEDDKEVNDVENITTDEPSYDITIEEKEQTPSTDINLNVNIDGVYRLVRYQIIQDFPTNGAYGYKKNLIRQDVLEDNVTEISQAKVKTLRKAS